MTDTHSASRIILATPRAIFKALIDPEAMPRWRAPNGMHMRVERLEARPGGRFRLVLTYDNPAQGDGKSGNNCDVVEGRYVELIAEVRIVEEVRFESDNPAFAGTMRVTTTLTPVFDGTKVTITAENVPSGISEDDHRQGMESTLRNLANFLE